MSLRLSSLFSMKEEESEEEPKLKYERLSNGVTEILQKDAASCMTVHDKFLALGTHYGKVYLLDVQGNITQKFDVINQVSLDESGEHMGVCAEDGKVWGLPDHMETDCPCRRTIIAVHPHFVRSSCKQFVTGGKKLLLFERSWMSRWKSSVLHEGEGNIRSVKWRGHLIAWANNMRKKPEAWRIAKKMKRHLNNGRAAMGTWF
uniref:Vps41 beta-propeller domain-containing protein n=1 Tax=Capra hircus TaxID=9925 RepID=A0A8C2SAX8_CAPHI